MTHENGEIPEHVAWEDLPDARSFPARPLDRPVGDLELDDEAVAAAADELARWDE